MRAGVDGLLRDRTRPSRIPPLRRAVVEALVTMVGPVVVPITARKEMIRHDRKAG